MDMVTNLEDLKGTSKSTSQADRRKNWEPFKGTGPQAQPAPVGLRQGEEEETANTWRSRVQSPQKKVPRWPHSLHACWLIALPQLLHKSTLQKGEKRRCVQEWTRGPAEGVGGGSCRYVRTCGWFSASLVVTVSTKWEDAGLNDSEGNHRIRFPWASGHTLLSIYPCIFCCMYCYLNTLYLNKIVDSVTLNSWPTGAWMKLI